MVAVMGCMITIQSGGGPVRAFAYFGQDKKSFEWDAYRPHACHLRLSINGQMAIRRQNSCRKVSQMAEW